MPRPMMIGPDQRRAGTDQHGHQGHDHESGFRLHQRHEALDAGSERALLSPYRALEVSRVYFIEICAPLRFVDLDVFGRGFHQVRVRSGGQHLAFHQQNDLVVMLHRRDLLRHRNQRDAGIILMNVLENGPLRVGIHARGEIVEQQHPAD